MNFDDVLSRTICLPELNSDSKEGVIREIIDTMARAGRLLEPEAALQAVLDREQKMSTGMQDGVALPHGKTDRVDGLVTALGLKRDGIMFESLDGKPARIFVMTLSSVADSDRHIRYLGLISRRLNEASVREELLEARTRDEMIAALRD